jgi:RNA polymerase sigma factor (sigma-70 family)
MQSAVNDLDGHEFDGVVEPILLARRLLRRQSDARLAELAAEGHERPFEVIVERYQRPLERYCRRFLAPAMAEDVVQQVFLAAWLALRRGTEVRSLHGWLYRIARNAAVAAASGPGSDWAPLREWDRCADAADSVLEGRTTVREALAALAALPERQREALLRIAVESRSPAEVADELGLSRNALRQLVFRARSTLRAGACAVSPSHLIAWVASLGQAGGGAATTTTVTSGVVLKAGAAVLATGALCVSTATLVARSDRGQEAPAAVVAASATGAAGAVGAGPDPVAHDSIGPPLRGEDGPRRRAARRPGATAPEAGRGPAPHAGGALPGHDEGPADADEDDEPRAPKSDADSSEADPETGSDPDQDSPVRHSYTGDESPDSEATEDDLPAADEGSPETDASETSERAAEAARAEDGDEPENGESVRNEGS